MHLWLNLINRTIDIQDNFFLLFLDSSFVFRGCLHCHVLRCFPTRRSFTGLFYLCFAFSMTKFLICFIFNSFPMCKLITWILNFDMLVYWSLNIPESLKTLCDVNVWNKDSKNPVLDNSHLILSSMNFLTLISG